MNLRCILACAVAWCVTYSAQAVDYKLEPVTEPAPTEVSAEISSLLEPSGVAIKRGQRTIMRIWLTKEWAVNADFKPSQSVLYPFTVGELIGVIEYKSTGEDFRGQEIPAGLYTLRYALQPVDGNHVGTSDTRDFLLMLPADLDTMPANPDEMTLFEESKKSAGGTHPAMLSLQRVETMDETLPMIEHDENRDLWIVGLGGKPTGGDGTLEIKLVVVGKFEE